ncbi:MAG: TrbC/VirB2 family protein [Anaerolineae bacterium]|nr:TrbC/VirB2 family protein [Anaerolineae bacterium]
MLNSAIVRPKITFPTMKSQGQQFIVNLRILDPATIRLMTALIVLGLLLVLPAGTALAQGGDEITTAFSGVVETIVGIIQGLAVVVGIAGLSVWGLARIARPIFPELSNLTQQYIGSLVIGVVVVFVAATVVEGLASAVGG